MTMTIAVSADVAARAKDERDLSVLRLACRGEKYPDIGRVFGKGGTFAQVLVGRIRDADLRESGEAAGTVIAAYPMKRAHHG
ncbi:hypothetical protein [Paracoccus cavernae]